MNYLLRSSARFSTLPKWATVDPYTVSGSQPHTVANILDGKVVKYSKTVSIPDPLNGETFLNVSTP